MSDKKVFLLPVILALLGLLAFWPGLHGGFIFDDYPNLVDDPDWKVDSLQSEQWVRASGAGIASGSGRPLAMLSFALNHYLSGLDPFPLKLTGLLLHVFNGALVFLLCRRLFELMPARRETERLGLYAAFLVALAWLVHPLQVSSALYIVQRMEVGAHTGVLLALLAYLAARRCQIRGARSWPWWGLATLAWLFGLGFKETALLVPGYALLVEFFGLRFQAASGGTTRILKSAYLAGAALALSFFLVYLLPWSLRPGVYSFRNFDLVERLWTQGPVLQMYIGQVLWPTPNRLTFYYDNFPVSTGLLSPPSTLASLLLLAGMVAGSLLLRRRWPLVPFGVLWFFCAHALTSNVAPLELAFEHRNYIALLGILVGVAQLLGWASSRIGMPTRRALAALLTACLLLLGAIQAHTWGDSFRLAFALDSRNPGSQRASFQLGLAMLERAGSDLKDPLVGLAIRQFERSAEQGSSPLPDQGLIVALSRTGQEVPPEVWERFQRKLRGQGAGVDYINALRGVLECRMRSLCTFDDQQLLKSMLVALERNPESALVYVQYANFAWNIAHEPELAIRVMREAIRLEPEEVQYVANLLHFLRASGGDPLEIERLEAEVASSGLQGSSSDPTRK